MSLADEHDSAYILLFLTTTGALATNVYLRVHCTYVHNYIIFKRAHTHTHTSSTHIIVNNLRLNIKYIIIVI